MHACIAALLMLLARGAAADQTSLKRYTSRHYVIYTNLDRKIARDYAEHMDKVFAEYSNRFRSFRPRRRGPMPLYLFQTESEYQQFLSSRGIDARNSGVMFVYNKHVSGLMVYTHGKSRQEVIETLQHEGFHQFAFEYIGSDLPIWANEGLAQYFEDGVIVGGRMHLGIANARRLRAVKKALAEDRAISFDKLLTISSQSWSRTLRDDLDRALLLYAQSWSVAYFLVHADDGRYRDAFEKYLKLVSDGRTNDTAFKQAFGSSDTNAFRQRWEAYVRKLEPDPLTTAMERLDFLGNAMRFLHQRGETVPDNMAELKRLLQRIRYRAWRSWPGDRVDYNARDDALFTFTLPDGRDASFELLEPSRNDLPPRIGAPGMKPEPVLEWSRDEDNKLVPEIRFR